jgi:transcriptional regulator with XRE-family HTH domain
MSKLAVAQAAGLDPRAITYVEENRRTPSLATVYRIALALDCEVHELLPETDG